jgi:hypothetical protein
LPKLGNGEKYSRLRTHFRISIWTVVLCNPNDILGLKAGEESELTETKVFADGVLPFYDRQRADADAANVVIVDLSLLASEVLENVTALIGRLIHEFLQRLSDPVSGVGRGLVLAICDWGLAGVFLGFGALHKE